MHACGAQTVPIHIALIVYDCCVVDTEATEKRSLLFDGNGGVWETDSIYYIMIRIIKLFLHELKAGVTTRSRINT